MIFKQGSDTTIFTFLPSVLDNDKESSNPEGLDPGHFLEETGNLQKSNWQKKKLFPSVFLGTRHRFEIR